MIIFFYLLFCVFVIRKLILFTQNKITFKVYSVRREFYGPAGHDGRNVYFTLAFAGIALMAAVFVGVAITKYRASRHPHAQGFVEVDQVSIQTSFVITMTVVNMSSFLFNIFIHFFLFHSYSKYKIFSFISLPSDNWCSSHTRRKARGQHANQRLRKSNVQIL